MSLQNLYSAVLSDALDSMGYRNQALATPFTDYSGTAGISGRCRTTLWADVYDEDENPYELELEAVDSCKPGDILICAAGGSARSGIWGELLTTAALNSGCRGVVVHGCVRDIQKMKAMKFPVFATGKSPYDSLNRQRVVDIDVRIEIDNVAVRPGDLIFGDLDGIVVVPREIEEEVIQKARNKMDAENTTREAIRAGMKASEAYQKYGVL
ncbi:MAG: RraA family protein [Balneolaceae bacterium]